VTLPIDSFGCRRPLAGFDPVDFMSQAALPGVGKSLAALPRSLRVLLDNMLRHEDGERVTHEAILALASGARDVEIVFHPDRVLMQDSAGLPVLGDLVALMDAAEATGAAIDLPAGMRADLVVDHAVEVDHWGGPEAAGRNLEVEFERNASRYRFMRWAEGRFPWLSIVPPGAGICHELNLEVLSDIVRDKDGLAGVDTLVGTDSHTPMINALGVVGWGVGGIEATSVLLGEPIVMRRPPVVGVRLTGALAPGILATDLALAITARLRGAGVVGAIVEFCGPGVAALSVPDRATVANMAPEYGATMGFFPADAEILRYALTTGRPAEQVALAEAFLSAQGLLIGPGAAEPDFDRLIELDLASLGHAVAGPSRPDQLLTLSRTAATAPTPPAGEGLRDGDVVIAAITSCTNTANPRALVAAGLLARKAVARGLTVPAWVKASFSPGSRIASGLLAAAGLQDDLDRLGFNMVGHGCMTCMGNSGPLPAAVAAEIDAGELSVAAVLSGNRNFEGRVHRQCRLAYLMSPALVVAYALAGNVRLDLSGEPLGQDADGRLTHLQDLWPLDGEIDAVLTGLDMAGLGARNRETFRNGPDAWTRLQTSAASDYPWEGETGFIRASPFLSPAVAAPLLGGDILQARPLLLLGDAVTTDHISPVSAIAPGSAAGQWLVDQGVAPQDLASFSARRLNPEVMLRGGFANPRLRNQLADGLDGGVTRLQPEGELLPIHVAAQAYQDRAIPMVVVAGARYGGGSARDWAAKVTRLLGVSAVLAEDFERIHRTNLVAMGVLPVILDREVRLGLDGSETFDLLGLPQALRPGGTIRLVIHTPGQPDRIVDAACRIDTQVEADWLKAGGVLPRMLQRRAPLPQAAAAGEARP
jgi:aconitate hydratase